jgi:tetratricopeptide (TPR) repeat protein
MPLKKSVKRKLSRSEQRELDVKIGFMEGVVKRDPQYIEALQILGDDYTKRGDFLAGMVVDERLSELRPDDPTVHYNLACSYSLTRRYKLAIAALDRALDLGYRDFKWLARDPDLALLRRHALYAYIRARIRRIKARQS